MHRCKRMPYRVDRLVCLWGLAAAAGLAGCTLNFQELALLLNTSSLGGTEPGTRGDLNVRFVNQTPYRVVLTFGTYDPLNDGRDPDLAFPIKFRQFVFDDTEGGTRLDAFSESEVIPFPKRSPADPGGCGRVISLGGEELIERIEDDAALLDTAAPEALRPLCHDETNRPRGGIAFFRETGSGPAENACDSKAEIAAWSDPVTTLQGDPRFGLPGQVRYPCDGSTVVYTFVEDPAQPGGIRVDVSVEPPAG